MESIGGSAVADDLAVNLRAATFRRLQLFQDHDPGAFANYKTIAIALKRPRSMNRIIVVRGQRAHRGEARHAHRCNSRLRTTADHDVGVAALNDLETISNSVRACGAGGGGS